MLYDMKYMIMYSMDQIIRNLDNEDLLDLWWAKDIPNEAVAPMIAKLAHSDDIFRHIVEVFSYIIREEA